MVSSAVYRPIRIAVPTAIIDAGTASPSPFQRTSKIVHDHTGIVFAFRWSLRSRSAGVRVHDDLETVTTMGRHAPRRMTAVMRSARSCAVEGQRLPVAPIFQRRGAIVDRSYFA